MLQQQGSRAAALPGGRFGQARQHRFQRVQLRFRHFAEQRHQHHALQPVHRDMLQTRPAPPTAMENAPYLARRVVQVGGQLLFQGGDGVEVHGGGS
ncbi:hypothetical protein FQZ97_1128600 [compost metagenome]